MATDFTANTDLARAAKAFLEEADGYLRKSESRDGANRNDRLCYDAARKALRAALNARVSA